jgi:hypothetical protein
MNMGLEPISAAVTSISGIFNYFKPSKSPYLVVLGALGYVLTRTEWSGNSTPPDIWHFVMIPVFVSGILVVILSFFYVPTELKIWNEQTDDEKSHVNEEIENQFKFARSIGVATGILCLYFLGSKDREVDFWFYTIYAAAVLQLAIFLLYLAIRNLKEEEPTKIQIFQIAVMTCSFLVFATLNYDEAKLNGDAVFSYCETTFEPSQKAQILPASDDPAEATRVETINLKAEELNQSETRFLCSTKSPIEIKGRQFVYVVNSLKKITNWAAVSFIYCLLIWFSYFMFWTVRLKSILKIKIII